MPDNPQNIRQKEFNKNVIQVYTQEPGFTGYKGFDFTAIDELESILRNQLVPEIQAIKDDIANGVNINQLDLDATEDQVDLGGESLLYLSGIKKAVTEDGININQIDLDWTADSVSVSGELYNILEDVYVTGENIPAGLTVYQANLDKSTDSVTAIISGVLPVVTYANSSSIISNHTPSGTDGIALNANQNRKEFYIQNLSTGSLYVKYGSGINNNSFNFILAANSYLDAGDGGILNDASYTGIVSASGAAATTRYISWERN